MCAISPSSPSASIADGVAATRNSSRVAWFTLRRSPGPTERRPPAVRTGCRIRARCADPDCAAQRFEDCPAPRRVIGTAALPGARRQRRSDDRARRRAIFEALRRANPDRAASSNSAARSNCWWPSFCRPGDDRSVNQATRELFRVAATPSAMLALGEEGLIAHIRTIGLFRTKARN